MGKVNRRKFLKGAALLGAAAVVPSIACAPASPSPTAAPAKPAATTPPAPAAPAATTAPAAAVPTSAPAAQATTAPIAAPTVVRKLTKFRIVSGTGSVVDPILLGQTIPMELGFYAEEGLEVEIIPASGSGGAGTMIAAGQGEVANTNAPQFILAAQSGTDFPLVTVYNWTRDVHWKMAVPEGSPIKSYKDMKGAKIGIANQGDSALPGGKAMLRESGLDPEKDAEWIAIGTGAPAAEAIKSKRVDALSLWDGIYAGLENLGLKFTYFEQTPMVKQVMGTGVGTHRDILKNRRAELLGFLRAMTKGTVFVLENAEEAIKIHWKLYPETKPKGKSEADALKETLHLVRARADKWPLDPVKMPRWGETVPKSWEVFVPVLGADAAKVGDVKRFWTNELVDDINKVDYNAVKQMAKTYKFKG